jgi:hypothetical protein
MEGCPLEYTTPSALEPGLVGCFLRDLGSFVAFMLEPLQMDDGRNFKASSFSLLRKNAFHCCRKMLGPLLILLYPHVQKHSTMDLEGVPEPQASTNCSKRKVKEEC